MRVRLCIATAVLLGGIVLPSAAQQSESVTEAMIANVLKQLGGKFSQQESKYSVVIKSRPFTLLRLDDGKRLLLKATIRDYASLETLNRYNDRYVAFTRADRHEKTGVALEWTIDCQLGVTEAGLKNALTRFVAELGEFEAFVAKHQGIEFKDEPKVIDAAKKTEKQKPPLEFRANSDDKEFVITFPTNEPKNWETAWKIVWDMETGKQANDQGFKTIRRNKGFGFGFGKDKGKDKDQEKGKEKDQEQVVGKAQEAFGGRRETAVVLFKIKQAWFKPGQDAEWIQVLDDAHPSEFYVPYFFKDTRCFDLRDYGSYSKLAPKEGGAISQTLGKDSRVMAELRDTGVAYKHGERTRRGEELTLWANFAAINYTYMVEFGFQDNGTIVFRHAPTGFNFFDHFDASHMHGSYWRIGVKLGPEGNNGDNQVYSVRLPTDPKEQGDKQMGKLNIEEITKESFLDWDPKEFTRIRVTNPKYSIVPAGKDRPALPISYDLVTTPQGLSRHSRFPDEKFTQHDFWITRLDTPEKMFINLGNYFFASNGELNPKLQALDHKNVALWHSSSALHTPRAEDGIANGKGPNNGQALTYWTTFELRPRNFFLKTPIYRPLP